MSDAARKRLIFALDVDSFEKAQDWVDQLHEQVGLTKPRVCAELGREHVARGAP